MPSRASSDILHFSGIILKNSFLSFRKASNGDQAIMRSAADLPRGRSKFSDSKP